MSRRARPHTVARLASYRSEQTPIVVVAAEGQPGRYLVIDGHKRIAALQQLGRDTVEAVVWPMGEAEALQLDRSLRFSVWPKPGRVFCGGRGSVPENLVSGLAGASLCQSCRVRFMYSSSPCPGAGRAALRLWTG